MSGIRDLLGGAGGAVIPPPPPMVFGEKQYTVTGKYAGIEVLSGCPIAGGWVSAAMSVHTKLQFDANGDVIVDNTPQMTGHAIHTNASINAAILWGTCLDNGVCTFDGMSTDFAEPSCLQPGSATVPYGGRLLYISDGIWNFARYDGSGGIVDHVYAVVWDGANNLTAVLLFTPTNKEFNVEFNTFVRCNLDVVAIESWLEQHACP